MKTLGFLLFPFGILYNWITTLRNFLYDKGVLKSTSFKIPIIAVGNLNVGGTGKTPQIEYLIRLLQDRAKLAVLSRGYKRATKGFVRVNSKNNYLEVGDEPLQFAKKFPKIHVAVDANRVRGINRLLGSTDPEIILLDDAFQHRKVKAGFYILLTKYDDLFTDDFLLPIGRLRESRRGAIRADLIVVSKCPENLSEAKKNSIEKKLNQYTTNPIFFSYINYHHTTKGADIIPVEKLKEYEILLITGIANPAPMLDYLSKKQCTLTHLKFSDHHSFTNSEIKGIAEKFQAIQNDKKLLLTTEKDYMRLSEKIEELSYLEIQTGFLSNAESFDKQITDWLGK